MPSRDNQLAATSDPAGDSQHRIHSTPPSFLSHWRGDLLAGFQVFLIALPLCLGISLASGFPPLAGLITAIIGSLIATPSSNAELAIKGPAAGMIVIVLGAVSAFGGDGMVGGWTAADQAACQKVLAVALVAGLLQVVFGLCRGGILGDFFPTTVVHGMLAAIGVIIISKQIPIALGVSAAGEPLEMLCRIPQYLVAANPVVSLIGLLSLGFMVIWPWIGCYLGRLRYLPSSLLVLAVTLPLGMLFDLRTEHSYSFAGKQYELGKHLQVNVPERMWGFVDELNTPDFSALATATGWQWVVLFFLVGTLESILSTRACEILDPWRRKVDLDRDLMVTGLANTLAAFAGGLPMISEIVRSRANIDAGAGTRLAGVWHGIFLLLCVGLIPQLLNMIPLAALAGMLIYTGFRLAHPAQLVELYHIGREQVFIFLTTLLSVLATDLMIGVACGILLKTLLHLWHGAALPSLFVPLYDTREVDDQTIRVDLKNVAIFSNWIPLRRHLERSGLKQRKHVVLNLGQLKLIDHSVMEKLLQLQEAFARDALRLELQGLEQLQPVSDSPVAARRRKMSAVS